MSTERGFISLCLALVLPLLLLSFVAGSSAILKAQNRMALSARLDVCAVKIMDRRIRILLSLEAINQKMTLLRESIYAARGLKVIPVAGQIASIAEDAALLLIRSLKEWQEMQVIQYKLEQATQSVCLSDKFSTQYAFCKFSLLPSLSREPTAFPDIPGNLVLESAKLFSVSCDAVFYSRPVTTRLILTNNEKLNYQYEN